MLLVCVSSCNEAVRPPRRRHADGDRHPVVARHQLAQHEPQQQALCALQRGSQHGQRVLAECRAGQTLRGARREEPEPTPGTVAPHPRASVSSWEGVITPHLGLPGLQESVCGRAGTAGQGPGSASLAVSPSPASAGFSQSPTCELLLGDSGVTCRHLLAFRAQHQCPLPCRAWPPQSGFLPGPAPCR